MTAPFRAGPAGPPGLAPPDVTRLADVTGLDQLGIPVWQAVRPLGRSLSCHMGKGLTVAAAIASALGEAREYADCEAYRPDRHNDCWADLPADERSAAPDDFAVRRGAIDAQTRLDWTRVATLAGPPLWVPSDAIAMDFTQGSHPGVAMGSTGQATADTLEQALRRALLECVERDAVARYRWLGSGVRRARAIAPDSVPYDWFQAFRQRADTLGFSLALDCLPALGPLWAFQLTITEAGRPGAACRKTGGWGAGFTTAAAVRAAMLEAAQSRVGYIAGARDDLPLHAMPPAEPPGWLTQNPNRRYYASGTEPLDDAAAVQQLQAALAAAGFARIGYVMTSAADAAHTTVKCFVPGLALGERTAVPR